MFRLCHVDDAKNLYLQGKAIEFISPQTSEPPPDQAITSFFIPDGNLIIDDRNGQRIIIPEWLKDYTSGPYNKREEGPLLYYLSGYHSMFGPGYLMQICSDPLNVLAEDCVDSVYVWIKSPSGPRKTGSEEFRRRFMSSNQLK